MKSFLFLATISSILLCVFFITTIDEMDGLLDNTFNSYLDLQKMCFELKTEYKKSTELQKALSLIDKKDYNRQTNNCYDHSKKLQKELSKADIASSIMINKDRSHAWLAVWIESTDGTFISSKNNFELLEVRDKNLDVICD